MLGRRFLDLYAGTGSVGLEALSQGASLVVFVESNRICVQTIEDNLKRLGWADRAKVYHRDVTQGLSYLDQEFDVIFMGPPYRDATQSALALTSRTLTVIEAGPILAEGGLVVAQHHAKENLGSLDPWKLIRQTKYGDSRLSFFEKIHAHQATLAH